MALKTTKGVRMRKLVFSVVVLSLMVVPFQNCAEHGGETKEIDTSSLERAQKAQAVLINNCLGCHDADAPAESKMTDVLNAQHLIDTGYISPGNPQDSRLYLDVIDGIMPKDENALKNEDILALAEWIRDLGESKEDPTGGVIPEIPVDGGEISEVTFAQVFGNIIQPKCVSCHGQNGPMGGVRLNTYNNVMMQVAAGNPAGSALYMSIESGDMPRPLGNDLPPLEKAAVFNWIRQGAQNN